MKGFGRFRMLRFGLETPEMKEKSLNYCGMFLTFVNMKTARILAAIVALTLCSCDGFHFNFSNNGNETPEDQGSGTITPTNPGTADPDHFWDPVVIDTDGLTKIKFTEDDTDFPNPERGFYTDCYFDSPSSSFSVKTLQGYRAECRSIAFFQFWMADYVAKDIPDNYLNCIRTAFSNARKAGVKALVRFGYFNGDFDCDNLTTPKPWDATKAQVLKHIAQLKPILQENADVLLCVQAGFVGWWGEWYYTDHFGYQPTKDSDYEPRREVINALLDAVPASRQVAVRTPTFKLKMLRLNATDTLTCATAYQNTPKARICGHNDCFLASADDYGTFEDDGERRFWEDDTNYTFMGGETCGTSSYSVCDKAVETMAKQHYSYLNNGYHSGVLKSWKNGGCRDEINRRLGYRLVLRNAWISPDIAAGSTIRTVFSVENVGFAAPINPRGLELILVDSKGAKTVIPVTTENPRLWLAGKTRPFEVDFKAPAKGSYTLYLNLPDPEKTLHDNPLYSIRLANKNTWDESTGYNKITTFEVK